DAQGYELLDDSATGTYRAKLKEPMRVTPTLPTRGVGAAPSETDRRQAGAPELFVISLRHARAADVATTINSLFGRSSAPQNARSGTSRAPTLGDELRAEQIPPAGEALPESVPGTVGRAAALTGELTIVSDVHGNNLLVRANRADFELIQAAVQQLDVRPPQVLIEVLIVEALRDRSFSLGVETSIADQRVKH